MGGGKAEKGTPKYIANKIKAKGLQKLRWYCQMCQKQCRDENGFKCHTMSESHQRQLLLFADNSSVYIDEFSKEFADGYCELLRRQFGTKRVNANKVYQDYIADREHLHMNATQWETLTEFVKWLGREGRCTVDETEKGWFVTHIDRDPITIANQEAAAKKGKMDKDDQERMMDFIEKQVERGKSSAGGSSEPGFTELHRNREDEKITVSLKQKMLPPKPLLLESSRQILDKRKFDDTASVASTTISKKSKDGSNRKMSALEEIKLQGEMRKQNWNRNAPTTQMPVKEKQNFDDDDGWLCDGIVVKVLTESLGSKYHKKKGFVRKVIDTFGAEVQMLDTGDRLKLDQEHLETVIPGIGRQVIVVAGRRRGQRGSLVSLEGTGCKISFQDGQEKVLEFNQVCKIHS